jgi:hypothetical protein
MRRKRMSVAEEQAWAALADHLHAAGIVPTAKGGHGGQGAEASKPVFEWKLSWHGMSVDLKLLSKRVWARFMRWWRRRKKE